jgi:hypothetical protein
MIFLLETPPVWIREGLADCIALPDDVEALQAKLWSARRSILANPASVHVSPAAAR